MKTPSSFLSFVSIVYLSFTALASAAGPVVLEARPAGTQLDLQWESTLPLPFNSSVSVYELERSVDLQQWTPTGLQFKGSPGIQGEWFKAVVDQQPDKAFYRLAARLELSEEAVDGAEVFGYASEFGRQLNQIGQISALDFYTRYNTNADFLAALTFDPKNAAFYTEFNTDPAVYNLGLPPGSKAYRSNDFRFNLQESNLFCQNGFVVSERLGSYSFPDAYYMIYKNDLPVFISADSILHAWHRSYSSMLQEAEELYLHGQLSTVLNAMAGQMKTLYESTPRGALDASFHDADIYLSVARTLIKNTGWDDTVEYGYFKENAKINQLLDLISSESIQDCELFGRMRTIDFSQFTVRGHYANSIALSNYFQAMMWCGRIDLRVAGDPKTSSPRELGTAVILNELLKRSGASNNWAAIDRTIQLFVGRSDYMNCPQIDAMLQSAGVTSLSQLTTTAALTQLQTRLMTGDFGFQQIGSDWYESLFEGEPVKLPRSFALLGQRFVWDSWVFSQNVYDSILWNKAQVNRRIPSALDAAFAALGNNQAVPWIYQRMVTPGRAFRDNLPYQHNLAATREVIDSQRPEVWQESMYNTWLAALRTLSMPTTGAEYPQAMRTPAWAMKNLNTQLASWTELRHDTVLYAKQSYTDPILCSYPDGFVEPRPEFYDAMASMATRSAQFVSQLNLGNQAFFMRGFASNVTVLASIARKELAQQPLSASEVTFIQNTMEVQETYFGRQYSGWYPSLYYIYNDEWVGLNKGCDKWDALVTDVHTDLPDYVHGDPGCILHEGVGNAHMLFIAVDNGPDVCMYAGPVFSHYEFEMPLDQRMTDQQWKDKVRNHTAPASPPWTQSYLVPGTYEVPAYCQ